MRFQKKIVDENVERYEEKMKIQKIEIKMSALESSLLLENEISLLRQTVNTKNSHVSAL